MAGGRNIVAREIAKVSQKSNEHDAEETGDFHDAVRQTGPLARSGSWFRNFQDIFFPSILLEERLA
jgi:hypothetical protein